MGFRSEHREEIDGFYNITMLGNCKEPYDTNGCVPYTQRISSLWNERGWTCQEELLAPRCLYFGKRHMWYQCDGVSWVEPSEPNNEKDLKLGSELTTSEWYGLANRIKLRAFTQTSDLLPSISGIANLMPNVSGEDYLAGLWSEDLHLGLFWMPSPALGSGDLTRQDVLETSRPYIAPSWSWASCAPGVGADWETAINTTFYNDDTELSVDVFEDLRPEGSTRAFTERSTQNPFGEVAGGLLRISVSMLDSFSSEADVAELVPPLGMKGYMKSSLWWSLLKEGNYIASVRLDWEPSPQNHDVADMLMVPLGSGVVNQDALSDNESGKFDPYFPTQLMEDLDHEDRMVFGLVVYPNSIGSSGSESQQGQFRRGGLFISLPSKTSGLKLFREDTRTVEII